MSGKTKFEPDGYLINLISAINDGAKVAQTGALALAALGFYLMAVCFSTTDIDLILGHTTSISQLGLQVAPQAVFGVAPLVFVALHAFTLIRYNLLSINLRCLRDELAHLTDPENQNRYRQLLANVEFVISAVVPRKSALYSWLFRYVWLFVIALFPIIVIFVVQIFSIRFQSISILRSQQAALLSDLAMLIWFFWRMNQTAGAQTENRLAWLAVIRLYSLKLLRFIWVPLVLAADFMWLEIPPAGTDTKNYYIDTAQNYGIFPIWQFDLKATISQPLDNLLCPAYHWGCRYLDGSTQMLVSQIWPDKLAEFNQTRQHIPGEEGIVQGVLLVHRNLRFSYFDGSDLTNAMLTFSDMTGAELAGARLNGANFYRSVMPGADFDEADLTDAHLGYADLTGTKFLNAQLANAQLFAAVLRSAQLGGANLTNADLEGADLTDAGLNFSHLEGANLRDATFDSHTDFSYASYTSYDSKDQCMTVFPDLFGDPITQHSMILNDDGEKPALNRNCPDHGF